MNPPAYSNDFLYKNTDQIFKKTQYMYTQKMNQQNYIPKEPEVENRKNANDLLNVLREINNKAETLLYPQKIHSNFEA